MEIAILRKRLAIAKWFLIVALIPLAILFVGSVPAIVAATGVRAPQSLLDGTVLALMFFVPLAAIFVLLPLVKALNRSMLCWGIGIVLLPLGVYILGGSLLFLGSRKAQCSA